MIARSTVSATSRHLMCLSVATAAIVSGLVTFSDSAGAATPTETAADQSVLSMLNAERAANHLPALKTSSALVSSARRHNLTMAAANLLSHQLPNEPVFSTRISQAGVNWHSAAENIGWTTDRTTRGANSLETAMYNEKAPNDGHRQNILSTSVKYVGIDTYVDARTGKLWLTQDFADVPGPAAPAQTQAAASRVAAAHNPVGSFDKAAVGPGHKVQLIGWTVDPDARNIPLNIAVYSDGKPLKWFASNASRPDVARALGAGPNQGYNVVIKLSPGKHVITVRAVNIHVGTGNPVLGSRTVVD